MGGIENLFHDWIDDFNSSVLPEDQGCAIYRMPLYTVHTPYNLKKWIMDNPKFVFLSAEFS